MSGAFLRRRDRTVRSLRVVHYSSAVNSQKDDYDKGNGWGHICIETPDV